MKQFEYYVLFVPHDLSLKELAIRLNAQGASGWELVSIQPYGVADHQFIFKREI